MNADPAELEKFGKARPPLVGPRGRVPAAARDQSAAPGLDRPPCRPRGEESARRRLRRRHPRRGDGAARRRGDRHRSLREGPARRRAASARIGARRALRESDGRGLRRRPCGRIRRRHLHGASRACPRARRHGRGVRAAWCGPEAGCSSRPSTAIPRAISSRWSAPSTCSSSCPRARTTISRFIKPSELSRWSRAAGLTPNELIGMTYNPITRRYRLGRDCDVNYLLACARDA